VRSSAVFAPGGASTVLMKTRRHKFDGVIEVCATITQGGEASREIVFA
jgi:hypothetical protein